MSKPSAAGEIWSDDITAKPEEPIPWIWQGLIAPGNLTLMTSSWKSGKTTLLSILLGLRVAGGSLGGLAVRPGRTLIVSEEPAALWAERARKHNFGDSVCFIPQPFQTIPTHQEWLDLVHRALTINRQHGVDMVVIDPLAPFLRSENQSRGMLETLLPLGQLLRVGMAAVLSHHPGRRERAQGQAARGSGALLGHVDISIDMRHPGGDPLTRRRRLFMLSRHSVTPRQLTLELNESGTVYSLAPESHEEQFEADWEPVRLILGTAPQKLTRQDVLGEWPADREPPNPVSLWRLLEKAVDQGLVRREGTGHKSDPFRYWQPSREEAWQQDPFHQLVEQQRQSLALPFESLTERKEKLLQAGESQAGVEGPNE
jgi:hypothetical protein